MSGGGRCNFTNTGATPANFLSANPHFCKSALARYTPCGFHRAWSNATASRTTRRSSASCSATTRRSRSCACCSTNAPRPACASRPAAAIERVQPWRRRLPRRTPARGTFTAPALVVASGGLSIPSMGASGFGYELARQFGHAVLPTRAGLVPLTLERQAPGALRGPERRRLAGRSARATARRFRNFMLITHRGISGPAILQISSYWQPGDDLRLDLLPDRRRARDAAAAAAPIGRRRNSRPCLASCCRSASRNGCARRWLREPADEAVSTLPQLRDDRRRSCRTGRSSPAAPKAIARPKSPSAASTPTSCPRPRCSRGACRACISSARSSTSPAGSAATTSSGRGRRATRRAMAL